MGFSLEVFGFSLEVFGFFLEVFGFSLVGLVRVKASFAGELEIFLQTFEESVMETFVFSGLSPLHPNTTLRKMKKEMNHI